MNILVISRRRHFKIRNDFSQALFPNSNIIHASDEKGLSGKEIVSLWWKNYSSKEVFETSILPQYEDMIARCRFLREIDKQKAINLIDEGINSWRTLLIEYKIDIIYCLPIDSYALQCLHVASEQLNLKFFSTVGTFFKNRIRITNFGELIENKFDNAENIETKVQDFINSVKEKSLTPEWLIGLSGSIYKTSIRRYLIDSLKPFSFLLYRILKKDFDSFSFPNKKLYKKRMFSTFKRMKISLKIEKNALYPEEIKNDYVFIPLQFYPEITSDYWNKNLELINHHEVVLKVINTFPATDTIIVKEHPAAFGRRDEKFLKKLAGFKNVKFAKTKSSMNQWLKNSRLIIGNASTTTVNAIILQKPVIFFAEPYFQLTKRNYFETITDEHLKLKIDQYKNETFNDLEIYELIKLLYTSSFDGSLGTYVPIGEKNKSQGFSIGEDFRKYINDFIANK